MTIEEIESRPEFQQLNRLEQLHELLKVAEPWSDRYLELAEEAMEIEAQKFEDDFDLDTMLANIDKARSIIMAAIKNEDQEDCFIEAAIACPICEAGKLSFRYAGHYNGHIGAWCDNCGIRWQE